MTESVGLLPCPFCDDPMHISVSDTLQHREQGDCPIGAYAWGASPAAVAAWNTRSCPAPASEDVEREPVAWLYCNEEGSKELVLDCNGEHARRLLEFGYTEQPLYALASLPSFNDGVEAAMKRAIEDARNDGANESDIITHRCAYNYLLHALKGEPQ